MLRCGPTSVAVLIVSLGACGAPASVPKGFLVTTQGEAIIFEGPITSESAEAFRSAAEAHPGKLSTVEITSAGGDAPAGVQIGTKVRELGLDVVVPKVCASACAQYVFPAGKRKRVAEGALVILHSSPTTMASTFAQSDLPQAQDMFRDQAAAEGTYLRSLGVDPQLLDLAGQAMRPICYVEDPRRSPADPRRYGVAWAKPAFVPTPDQLRDMGLTGIEGSWPSNRGVEADLHTLGFSPKFQPVFNPALQPATDDETPPIPIGRCESPRPQ